MPENHPLVVNLKTDDSEGVFIGRGSPWGNPFIIGVHGSRKEVIRYYAEWLDGMRKAPNGEKHPPKSEIRKHLQGRKLRCYCAPKYCHGTVLANIANPNRGLFW